MLFESAPLFPVLRYVVFLCVTIQTITLTDSLLLPSHQTATRHNPCACEAHKRLNLKQPPKPRKRSRPSNSNSNINADSSTHPILSASNVNLEVLHASASSISETKTASVSGNDESTHTAYDAADMIEPWQWYRLKVWGSGYRYLTTILPGSVHALQTTFGLLLQTLLLFAVHIYTYLSLFSFFFSFSFSFSFFSSSSSFFCSSSSASRLGLFCKRGF